MPSDDSTIFIHQEKLKNGVLDDIPNASLVIQSGALDGFKYRINREMHVLGRDQSADFVVEDDAVSRKHATLSFRSGRFYVKDLGSTNGTSLNGQLFQGKEFEIRNSDVIQLGDTLLKFELE